jgi:hypothetical protein
MDPQTTPAVGAESAAETPAEVTAAAVTTPAMTAPTEEAGGTTAAIAAGELEKVRELVLKANPDVVPDLVRGGSIDELLASVEPARGAYQRVAEAVRAGTGALSTMSEIAQNPAPAQPPAVPAGGASNVVDPSTLAPTTKIAQGLAQHRKP